MSTSSAILTGHCLGSELFGGCVSLTSTEPQLATMSTIEGIRKCSLITAIKTPYRLDGKFDLQAYDALVEIQIANGVEGLIIGGTTGEGHLMSWSEHIMLIAHTAAKYGTRIKVIGNTGSNNTSEATEATEQGFAVGMHCALQINPYYGKTSRQGLIHHFTKCLDLGPSILYNVPSRTGQVCVSSYSRISYPMLLKSLPSTPTLSE
jgi:4-hydroxy-tetrahydrodipicolinate synthase